MSRKRKHGTHTQRILFGFKEEQNYEVFREIDGTGKKSVLTEAKATQARGQAQYVLSCVDSSSNSS